MRNKKLVLCFLILILMVSVGLEAWYLREMMVYTYQTTNIEDYGVSLKYPRAYENVEKEDTNVEQISSQITSIATETEKETSGDKFTEFTKELLNVKSSVSDITLLIEGLKTEKVNIPIEEICKNYIVMFKIFNSSLTVDSTKYEEVEVDGKKGGRVEIYTQLRKDQTSPMGIIAYLFPLDDREITITFMGTKKLFEDGKDEIQKIIDSVKFE